MLCNGAVMGLHVLGSSGDRVTRSSGGPLGAYYGLF